MRKLIKNVNIFDGKNSSLLMAQNIVVEDNLVKEITDNYIDETSFQQVIDGRGKTAMPGMVDSHVHLGMIFSKEHENLDYAIALSVAKCKDMLYAGFTTLRDAGSVPIGLKRSFDCGVLEGPRIYPCNSYISQTSGHGDEAFAHERRDIQYRVPSYTCLVDGKAEMMRAVREQFYRGASHIKLMAGGGCVSACDPIETVQFTLEESKAAVEVARDYGSYVMAHLYTPKCIRRALEAGIISLEHAHMIDDETAKAVEDAGAYVDPMPQFNKYQDMIGSENMPEKDALIRSYEDRATEVLNRHNIKILFGTDTMITGPDYKIEQSQDLLYYKKRFGNYRTIYAATGMASEILSMTTYQNPYPKGKIGLLEEGAYADILLVEGGNPAEDVAILSDVKNIKLIMKDGIVYKDEMMK